MFRPGMHLHLKKIAAVANAKILMRNTQCNATNDVTANVLIKMSTHLARTGLIKEKKKMQNFHRINIVDVIDACLKCHHFRWQLDRITIMHRKTKLTQLKVCFFF